MKFSESEYINLVKSIYELISLEIVKGENSDDPIPLLPQIGIMYEFFRLLRGEAFHNIRPETPGFQKDMYQMEVDISRRLNSLRAKVDISSVRYRSYLDETLKPFLI